MVAGPGTRVVSWQQYQVAIPLPVPSRVVVAFLPSRVHVGKRKHWVDDQPDNNLVLLRSTVNLRTTAKEPELAATDIAFKFWGQALDGLADLSSSDWFPAWAWPT